ncbi:MAG: putative molybdenum carrier protein, partial [Nitrospirales bacterium]
MVIRIVSGGQTGADRAALDFALHLGIECGGWVPKGRTAEDGVIPAHYPNLVETDSDDPNIRTEFNVRD